MTESAYDDARPQIDDRFEYDQSINGLCPCCGAEVRSKEGIDYEGVIEMRDFCTYCEWESNPYYE